MDEDLMENKAFSIPIIEAKIKSKNKDKEYFQYMVKFPKKLVKKLKITKNSVLRVELLPIKENQDYPEFKIELQRGTDDKN